jgi:transcriptional regulator with XRE-family HTH domain
MNIDAKFGSVIRALREARNMSQDDLAQGMGYKHRGSISHLEKGERAWTLENISAAAKALSLKLSALMKEFEKP